jgi:hypothetical protein
MGNLKAIRGKLIVKSYANQKEALVITGEGGKKIELWIGRNYGLNHRVKNPVLCEVIDNNSKYSYIKKGDLLLLHHNYLSDWETNPFCLEYNPQTGEGLFSFIASNNIYCKINKDGTATPVCENILAERLTNRIQTSLIIVPDTVKQEHEDRVRVLSVAPEVEGIKKGDIVAILEKADYEICYSWENQDYTLIKVFGEDIVGVLEEV